MRSFAQHALGHISAGGLMAKRSLTQAQHAARVLLECEYFFAERDIFDYDECQHKADDDTEQGRYFGETLRSLHLSE